MESIQTVDQLLTCICYATEPNSPNKDIASTMLNRLFASSDGGSFLCIQLMKQSLEQETNSILQGKRLQMDNIIFYALTTLQKALSLRKGSECIVPYDYRLELRKIIYEYILKSDMKGIKIHFDSNQRILPSYQRTKIGVVLSLLIQADFPERWQTAFHELAQLATSFEDRDKTDIMRKDIYLRTLDAFCDEIVEDTTVDKNSLIKDTVRGLSNNLLPTSVPSEHSISAMIIQSILEIFKSCVQSIYISSNDELLSHIQKIPVKCLAVLKRLISWFDLSLILDSEVLMVLFTCVNHAGPGDPDDDKGSLPSQLAVEALECLKEILNKGMDEQKKIKVIMSLDLLSKIANSGVNLTELDRTHTTVVIKVAELLTIVGLELLTYYSSPNDSEELNWISAQLDNLIPLFFLCFAYDDIDVSGAVIDLASKLVTTLETEAKQSKSESVQHSIAPHIPKLLSIMFNQMKYPENFEFDYEDEDEAEEEVYRSELRKLNQTLTRIAPEMSLEFLCTSLSKIKTPLSSAETRDLEAVLRLIYHYCEGIRPSPGTKVVLQNPTFCNVLIALHSSDITMHPHREVIILYYDIVVRYADIFHSHLEILPYILESISGTRGLQNEHPRVRSRSCYLLLKLVKALGSQLRPYVETAIRGIQGLLSTQASQSLHPEDSLYLFETIGLLLGKTNLDPIEEYRYLESIIVPFICDMEESLSALESLHDLDITGDKLAYSIASLAFISKGFTKNISNEVKSIFSQTIPVCLRVLKAIPSNDGIRNKIMIFIQRMIILLEVDIIPKMPEFFHLIISNCKQDDILDIGQMFYQLSLKFKSNAIPAIEGSILHFLRKCHEFLPTEVHDDKETALHRKSEVLAIKKIMFATLNQIVSSGCSSVLVSSDNASSLENVLSIAAEGAISIDDPISKRTCLQFFKELVSQWLLGTDLNSNMKYSFHLYLVENVLPGIIRSFSDPAFDVEDAMQYRSIREFTSICMMMKTMMMPKEFEVVSFNLFQCCNRCYVAEMINAKNQPAMEKCIKLIVQDMKKVGI
jgi:exportin-T